MYHPTVANYCDAMRSVRNAFRTLRDVVVAVDQGGEPIYRASSRSVRFNVTIGGVARSIRAFTGRVTLSIDRQCELLRGELFVITENGGDYYDVVVEPPFEIRQRPETAPIEIHENRARFPRGDLWGFTDAMGCVAIEPKYDMVEDFSEGRAVVAVDGLFGLIDDQGREIIDLIYDDLSYDGSHLCYTERDGLWGVVDRMGHVVTDNQWDWVAEYSQGMLLVELAGKYGFLDKHGLLAIEIKYDNATSFDANGYSTVVLKGRTYQIDKEEFRV